MIIVNEDESIKKTNLDKVEMMHTHN